MIKKMKMKNQKIVKWKIKFVPPDGTLGSTTKLCT